MQLHCISGQCPNPNCLQYANWRDSPDLAAIIPVSNVVFVFYHFTDGCWVGPNRMHRWRMVVYGFYTEYMVVTRGIVEYHWQCVISLSRWMTIADYYFVHSQWPVRVNLWVNRPHPHTRLLNLIGSNSAVHLS